MELRDATIDRVDSTIIDSSKEVLYRESDFFCKIYRHWKSIRNMGEVKGETIASIPRYIHRRKRVKVILLYLLKLIIRNLYEIWMKSKIQNRSRQIHERNRVKTIIIEINQKSIRDMNEIKDLESIQIDSWKKICENDFILRNLSS